VSTTPAAGHTDDRKNGVAIISLQSDPKGGSLGTDLTTAKAASKAVWRTL